MATIKRSEHKLQIREEAKQKVKGSKYNPSAIRKYAGDVEQGLKHLREKASDAGDWRAKKAKSELLYLINNYLPRYEARIEALIDQWRRSGDPSYDPGIRAKLRMARREHANKGEAL